MSTALAPVALTEFPPSLAKETRNWYAVLTAPQHEKSVVRHLDIRGVESYVPTYESVRVWKNRQRVKLRLPLFPSYLFVHIDNCERRKVLESPGVWQILGNHREPIALPDETIEFLRSDACGRSLEPYSDLVIGQTVRIRSGAFRGLEGTLVRKNNRDRFVMTIRLINRHVAAELDANDLEPIPEGAQ